MTSNFKIIRHQLSFCEVFQGILDRIVDLASSKHKKGWPNNGEFSLGNTFAGKHGTI